MNGTHMPWSGSSWASSGSGPGTGFTTNTQPASTWTSTSLTAASSHATPADYMLGNSTDSSSTASSNDHDADDESSASSSSYRSSATVTPAYVAVNASATSVPMTPDVVANPWNTSLLWSGGILDNRDPRSNFWPSSSWYNRTVPNNVNTAPIDYYYASSTAGDAVNFYFTGHGLSVLDFKGPRRGRYNVTIDQTSSAVIDAYSETDQLAIAAGSELPPVIWTSDTLAEGTHSVVMTNLNNITEMEFWGVVINPNNYRPGKSFMHSGSNVKTIIIASSVTALFMLLVFVLIGSLLYYCKLVKPRRRLQAQMDTERKELALLPDSERMSSSYGRTGTSRRSESQLRLNTDFLSSQGDLGRVPSRVTATTNESQYWVRSETELAQTVEPTQSTRVPALFQEVQLASPTSDCSSPVNGSPASEVDPSSTNYSTEMGDPLSPLSPTTMAYPTVPTPTQNLAFWDQSQPQPQQTPAHQHSSSLNMYPPLNASSSFATSGSHIGHTRAASSLCGNPFQDPPTFHAGTTLARTVSRRPLPTPPTRSRPTSPISPAAHAALPLPLIPRIDTTVSRPAPPVPGRSANHQYRVEQDACSLHLSEEGLFDDNTGETLLPPPYAPRDMGREFV